MTPLLSLWLPILLSGVGMFFLGFIFWMVLPHHRTDWSKLPDEDGVMKALADHGVKGPGQFSFPHCGSPEAMKDPAFIKKMEDGPSGMMTIMKPGKMNMGKSMFDCVLHNVIVALVIAYAAGLFLAPGAEFMDVFRLTGTMGILAFCGAVPTQAIWFHQSWSSIGKNLFDGVVMGIVLGLIFASLWPAAAAA